MNAMPDSTEPSPDRLAAMALTQIGSHGSSPLTIRPLTELPATNSTYLLVCGEQRYTLKIFCWPHRDTDDLERAEKETWLSEVVSEAGIPVPKTLSVVRTNATTALLREYVHGELLGDAPTDERRSAWRAVGESLAKIHEITVGDGTAGMIAGHVVRPFPEGTWGQWHLANAIAHAESLAGHAVYDIDPDEVVRIYTHAQVALDERPVRLLHNDPHAWNVLVDQIHGEWQCTGWLDWEFAWAGDPIWDAVRTDVFRLADIGETPATFFDGYGQRLNPAVWGLYEFSIRMWMANEALAEGTILESRNEVTHRKLQQGHQLLQRLDEDVDRLLTSGDDD